MKRSLPAILGIIFAFALVAWAQPAYAQRGGGHGGGGGGARGAVGGFRGGAGIGGGAFRGGTHGVSLGQIGLSRRYGRSVEIF